MCAAWSSNLASLRSKRESAASSPDESPIRPLRPFRASPDNRISVFCSDIKETNLPNVRSILNYRPQVAARSNPATPFPHSLRPVPAWALNCALPLRLAARNSKPLGMHVPAFASFISDLMEQDAQMKKLCLPRKMQTFAHSLLFCTLLAGCGGIGLRKQPTSV